MPKSLSLTPDFAEIAAVVAQAARIERESQAVGEVEDDASANTTDSEALPTDTKAEIFPELETLPARPKVEETPEIRLRPPLPWYRGWLRRTSWSFALSTAAHIALLVLLAWLVETVLTENQPVALIAWFETPSDDDLPLEPDPLDTVVLKRMPQPGEAPEFERQFPVPKIEAPADIVLKPRNHEDDATGMNSGKIAQLLTRSDAPVAGALGGRGTDSRASLAQSGGGTPQSEAAVDRALRWLMAQQCTDGSWNFNHHKGNAGATSPNPGTESSITGATAIALLPFLGAGQTHLRGEYQQTIYDGLHYLGTHGVSTQHGNDLQDGTMYAQGLATIALCEAYAMTEDPALKPLAQEALKFVVHAQSRETGGWRYSPGEPGDMTVTGWQLMSLKSGQMARLDVSLSTIFKSQRFLDSLQTDRGSQYGYQNPTPRRSTTAIGLLMRMYTGWQRSNPGLQRGVEHLHEWGPSEENIYYDYYATQVMHHWGGPMWEKWNTQMRDYLVATQASAGNASGSWYFPDDPGAEEGGRLYCTAMAAMILEVYYRYMPLYKDWVVDPDF